MDQHFQETHFHATFANPSETTFHSNAPSIGNMVSVTATTRMKTYGVSTVPQQTRHARRIYVGGIPPNYISEDGIRNFMNTVIAQGLGEENDHSYVLSVYVNQKKCFAFVELKSIELTAACLDLDGIVMKNVVLRILRANEYKPELIPQNFNKVIKFDLSSFQFGPTTSTTAQISDQEEVFVEKTLDTIVQFTGLNGLEVGSVSIVGFPFDEPARKSIGRFATSNTPKLFRSLLHKFKYGMVDNPEFDVDLSKLKVLDVGDILAGKSFDDTKLNLATTTAELIARGCVPFVVGGCKELGNCSSSALLSLYGSKLVTIYVSSRGDIKILDDLRFYGTKFPLNCQGRYVVFAAQGSEFSKDEASFIGEHGGKIVWLSKHLRAPQSLLPSESFRELLKEFESSSLAVMVTLDASALAASANPHASNICSPHGLDFADFAEIAKIAGADPNVVLVNLTEFTIEAEEHSRENFLPVDIFYNFLLGFSLRKESQSRHRVVPNIQTSYQRPFITNVPAYEKAINQLDSVMSRNVVELRQLPSESSLGLTTSQGVRAEPLAFSSTSNLLYASSNLKSAADLHRSLGKTTSTISTVSSNSQNDRYNRSSSSYTFKNSSSFNYSLNPGLGGSQRIGGVSPSLLGTSGILTQSLPDMFGELHSFDENIDLHTESEKAHKASVKAPPNLKILATQSNDTMHTLPYTSATISEAVASPSSHVGGFIFDDKLLSNHLNMENRDN